MKNVNSEAIFLFCSRLCMGGDVSPLEPQEWTELATLLRERGFEPKDLLSFTAEDYTEKLEVGREYAARLVRLAERGASLAFERSRYENMGVKVMTRADGEYPLGLKKSLGNSCPPLFYYAGDPSLLSEESVGYVGSRAAEERALNFTASMVERTTSRGFGVVTGGAKGVDTAAEQECLSRGGHVIEYLADSMLRKLRSSSAVGAVQSGKMLLLSSVSPEAGFHAGNAMSRNRYIYAQSAGTVVVRADLEKGGTWAGATENLRSGRCPLFCWKNEAYPGNMELIRRGAIPIGEDWDGDVSAPQNTVYQPTFFD